MVRFRETDEDRNCFYKSIRSELQRRTITNLRVLRLKLVYYARLPYRLQNKDLIWIRTWDRLQDLLGAGDVIQVGKDGEQWVYLSTTPEAEALALLDQKHEVMLRWNQASYDFGKPFEHMIRQAFRESGYAVADGPVTIETLVNGVRERVEIDVYTTEPFHIFGTCKNVLSEVILPPNFVPGTPSKVIKNINRDFKAAGDNDMIPILFAPAVDDSFYRFARAHDGLFWRSHHHYLYCPRGGRRDAAEATQLANDIKRTFAFGHVKAVHAPPPKLLEWISSIPEKLYLP